MSIKRFVIETRVNGCQRVPMEECGCVSVVEVLVVGVSVGEVWVRMGVGVFL